MATSPPCVLRSDDCQMVSPLETHLVQLPEGLSGIMGTRVPMSRHTMVRNRSIVGRTPILGLDTQDLSDREIFVRLTHESSDESESMSGPYWTPKPANSECIPSLTFKDMEDGWDASRELPPVPPGPPSTPLSSWQPYPDANASRSSWVFRKYEKQLSARPAGTPLVIEPLDVPLPSVRVVPDVTHPVQYEKIPIRLPLPRPDDEILSGNDEDISRRTYCLGISDPG